MPDATPEKKTFAVYLIPRRTGALGKDLGGRRIPLVGSTYIGDWSANNAAEAIESARRSQSHYAILPASRFEAALLKANP